MIRNIVLAALAVVLGFAALALLVAPPLARADGAEAFAGWSAGGQVGYARGSARTRWSAGGPEATRTSGVMDGGVQLGWARALGPDLVLGLEAGVSFPNFLEGNDRVASGPADLEERVDATGALRARAGWAAGQRLLYGTGGLAFARGRFVSGAGGAAPQEVAWLRPGLTLGAGIEVPVAPSWTARLEVRHDWLARARAELGGVAPTSTLGVDAAWLGLSWRFGASEPARAPAGRGEALPGDAAAPPAPASPFRQASLVDAPAPGIGVPARPAPLGDPPASEAGDRAWNVHGQSTLVVQGYPGFRSPYQGENSLSGRSQVRNTTSATAFLGLRAWDGGELYVNPELMQGFGLSDTRGVAGFPNGEAQRSDFPVPRFNVARIYLSQTFDLGGERERVEDGPNQLPGERPVSRVTVSAGKLAVTDFFLVNGLAGEPRTGFLNWNVYGGGAYDWTMDLLSWTWGALAELNQPRWALRAGYFLLPAVSNTNRFDGSVPRDGQWTAELEVRHALLGRTGKVQLFGWLSHGNIGSYPAALAAAAVGTPPDVASTRGRDRFNSGVVVSVEQPVTDALGVFSRASWSPERGETMGWTDCGRSLSLGAVAKGTAWRRPQDAAGIAALVEGLSPVARRYFTAGGRGTIIGDGAMAYRPEQILETYYTVSAGGATALTLDHQLIVNPGYNADRGPVSVSSVRLHAAF